MNGSGASLTGSTAAPFLHLFTLEYYYKPKWRVLEFFKSSRFSDLTAHLMSSELDADVDVVIAPPACYIAKLAAQVRVTQLQSWK